MGLDEIQNGITGAYDKLEGITGDRTASVIGGAVIGSVVAGTVIAGVSSIKKKHSKTTKRKYGKITHTKRGLKQDRKRVSKEAWEQAYQRHKRKHHSKKSHSRKGIHYTKNGQPYKIMANGRARFIKKQ